MSALAPVRAPAAPARPRSQPQLRVVEPTTAVRGRVAFVVLVGAILVGGLVSLLMLHTLAAQDAFTLHRLQRHAAALQDVEQQLSVVDQQAQAPSVLAARARALGLVPTTGLHFVHRRNGTLVAVATAAPMAVVNPPAVKPSPAATPSVATKPSPAASASPAASSSASATRATPQGKTKPKPHVHHSASHHG